MKLTPIFLIIFTCLTGSALGNIFLSSYELSMEVKANYDYEATYFRAWLTWEAQDMADLSHIILDGIPGATTEDQGAKIAQCTAATAATCRNNILFLDSAIIETEEESLNLHSAVYRLLATVNIIQMDLDTFYEYHKQLMEGAQRTLQDRYIYNMLDAWVTILFEFYDIEYDLNRCIYEALN